MKYKGRRDTLQGKIDVYVGEEKVQLATLRGNGVGYLDVTTHKRFFYLDSVVGDSKTADFVVAGEPIDFKRVSRGGNLVYVGRESRGKVVLSREPMPNILSKDSCAKTHDESI